MKYLISLLAVCALTGCADTTQRTNFQPIYDSIGVARASAVQIETNGTKAGSPEAKAMVQHVDDITTQVQTVQADADAKADKLAADEKDKALKSQRWTWVLILGVFGVVVLTIAAPFICDASTGAAAFVKAIPIIGGFATYAEEAAGFLIGFGALLIFIELGKLVGWL